MKKIGSLLIALFAVFFLQSCTPTTENEETEVSDSLTIVDEKPTRESLIVNRNAMAIQDPENPNDFELKHTPEITVNEADEKGYTVIDVVLGSDGIIHPATEAHWIDYISLYVDGELVETKEFENNDESGKTSFFVPLGNAKKIRIEAACNLHGVWNNETIL